MVFLRHRRPRSGAVGRRGESQHGGIVPARTLLMPAPGPSPIQYNPVVFQVDNRANSGARVRCEPLVSGHFQKNVTMV